MSVYFVDTSALSKRYVSEIGSSWVKSWIEPQYNHQIIISQLTLVETIAALARRQRENRLPLGDFVTLKNTFLIHAHRHYRVIRTTNDVIQQAQTLVSRHPLRTLDSIQLSAAIISVQKLTIQPIFISADQKLLSIANLEGFQIDNPHNHP